MYVCINYTSPKTDSAAKPGKELSPNFNDTSLFSELHVITSGLASIFDIKQTVLNKFTQSNLDLIP